MGPARRHLGTRHRAEREALTREIAALARRTSDPEMEHIASSLRWVALLEQGDPRYLDQYRAFVTQAQRNGQPRLTLASLIDRSIITALLGRFDEAEALLDQAAAVGDSTHADYGFMLRHLRWALWLLQGRFDELDRLHRWLDEREHPHPGLLAAITAAHRGDVGAALQHLDEHSDAGQAYPRSFAPLWLRFQAEAAAASGDPELCERARAALAPYRDLWAVSVYGCDISGPMRLWLALLDAAQERWDDAVDGFTAAAESADQLKARPWAVQARAHLAQTLLARAAAGDAEAASALLDAVEREATEIGMRHVVERVQRARGEAAAADAPVTVAEPADGGNVFRFDGQVWSLGYRGRTVHMPDAKGLRDLHILLARPGADVPAVQLLDPEGGELVVAARRLGGDDVLDEEAKAQYKRRLDQLDEEIDRATELGDDRRAAERDRERDALLRELRAAAGLAGRSRRLGDEAERARKTVTARIRDTLRKLDQRHPALAAHLHASVSTGASCAYRPDGEVRWRL